MKVLIVDDSKTMRSIVKNCLGGIGYSDVEEACDGQDALEKVAQCKPGLILLDWNMPNMNGIDFLKAYRAKGGKAPVVMVTTESEKARVIDAIRAGANDFVVKPFTPDVLAKHVNRTIEKAQAA
ncbi:MAG: response regulator [Phycisphaeraceae bacterium]|nr:response regulator [Phycisphaerales bacterium]MCA9305033.1 response regulator [Phycisphaerales bacterium]MCB9841640.1 response regulator [Phycisphaeraceae bacterium]